MRFSFVKISVVALVATFFIGCAQHSNSAASNAVLNAIKEHNLQVVNYEFVASKLGDGTRNGAKAIFIDARPSKKYESGTIPSSIQINDSEFNEHIARISKVAKDKEIIVFCQGWDCKKSANVATKLKDANYTKVELYQARFPDWAQKNYIEVGTNIVKNAYESNSALLIDARPYAKFIAETIPGAISIPDSDIDALLGRFPNDKKTKIITFCQGYDCKKSHVVARKLISLGYTNVSNYSAGISAWKEAGLKTTKNSVSSVTKNAVVSLSKPFLGPIKKGLGEGTVDPEWFLANYSHPPKDVTIIDVRKSDERANGFLPHAMHISVEENDVKSFAAKLPKTYVIFHCSAGSRALEAWQKAKKAGFTKAVYIDASFKCDGSDCKFTPNEPLDPTDW